MKIENFKSVKRVCSLRFSLVVLALLLFQYGSAIAAVEEAGSLSESFLSLSQDERTVSGVVTDATGEPLIAVSVVVKGTTVGTATDFDGNFHLVLPEGSNELEISYLGFRTEAVNVAGKSTISVVMHEDTQALDELVVTALGIKRETKSLTYSVQQVNAAEISTVKSTNFIGSLAGKLAGVTINQSSSGVGGSTRVVMRGAKSLFGNNNALYVLDGIPMAAMKSKQSSNFYESEGQGDSEGIAMLNADDIETMSVLTGAAAAALYGSQGANGVVLITSKKGQDGKLRVSYSNNTVFSSPFIMPEFQNTYGRKGEEYNSWGNKLETPSTYKPSDFFQTGTNTQNNLAISTGNETHLFRASFGATNARGLVPNSKYERYNLTMRSSSELISKKLNLDMGLNYVRQNDRNPLTQGLYYNPWGAVYLFPPGDDFNRFVPYKRWDAGRGFMTQNWSYKSESLEGLKQNPLWTAHRNVFDNSREKLILNGSLTYNITEWLNASVRARMDKSFSSFERRLYASSEELFARSIKGNYSEYSRTDQSLYADFLINFDKNLGEDFRLVANFGGSFNDERSKFWGFNGPLIAAPDFFHITNVNVEENKTEQYHTRNNAWYGTAQLGYRGMLYLDATLRVDYFSTLYGPNNKKPIVPYPSYGATVVMSELLSLPQKIVPLWKIRTAYSQVGNPPPAYLTREFISMKNGAISPTDFYPVDLKPEKTKAFEIGTELHLFGDLMNLALTYYNTNTYNQLFKYKLPSTTGYAETYANAGRVNNNGIELTLGMNKSVGSVDWQGTVAFTKNNNKIIQLLGDQVKDPISGEYMTAPKEFEVANANNAYRMLLTEGGTMGDIYVSEFKRDLNGHVYVDPGTGSFAVDKDNFVKIGSAAPKYTLSFRNKFEWNGLSLGFMFDARVGGVVVSSTQALLDFYGVSKASADARDNGGVPMNFGKIPAETYYTTVGEGKVGSALSQYTYSATNVRLRELSLAYAVPSKWTGDRFNMSVSFVAQNLWMLYSRAPFDPELTSNTGTYYQGYDYFMPPSQQNIGFGINITF